MGKLSEIDGKMKPEAIVLSNGLTLLHLQVAHTQVAHCALVANAGTRDESPAQAGMAHFIEHMVFRGTRRRSNTQILNFLESVGGDLNAYTTKEKTCLYASLPGRWARRAFDLLADLAFHPTLPARDIAKEQQVIGDEIDMYKENPEEMLFEEFENVCFPEGRLGRPILGTKESIHRFSHASLRQFMAQNYTRDRVIFCAVGAISRADALKWAAEHLEPVHLHSATKREKETSRYKAREVTLPYPSAQAHRIIGGRAIHLHSRQMPAFLVLNNHLGGPAMNSRLSMNVREKHGLTYNIYSFFSPYFDKGVWGTYFACDPGQLDRVTKMVHKEIAALRDKKTGDAALHRMKQQFIGNLILGQESLLSRTLSAAKDYLDFGRIMTLEQMIAAIEKVTAAEVQDAAQEWMSTSMLSTITFAPEQAKHPTITLK